MTAAAGPARYQASLVTVLREWGRIGCIGFGGPPAHIALLRLLCVDRRQRLDAQEFEDAIVPLAAALGRPWQYAVLGGAAVLLLGLRRAVVLLLGLRRAVVLTLLAAAATGLLIALAGGPLPP